MSASQPSSVTEASWIVWLQQMRYLRGLGGTRGAGCVLKWTLKRRTTPLGGASCLTCSGGWGSMSSGSSGSKGFGVVVRIGFGKREPYEGI